MQNKLEKVTIKDTKYLINRVYNARFREECDTEAREKLEPLGLSQAFLRIDWWSFPQIGTLEITDEATRYSQKFRFHGNNITLYGKWELTPV